ncbi:hypothetical protein DL89DRAFT_155121 [Linderina pennispora]|uniref:Uncharacterized protein n=1 Tax=Linderina pennispora TaxID=61395 RepID=A0A1Y1WA93_9FUNG|nr:uncharacterized protein DL89DRAFT_155121 [Linderina pennispora]ORX70295.1 hypothetical protein DL89DRAFT_155121 [Linderina pennispora]
MRSRLAEMQWVLSQLLHNRIKTVGRDKGALRACAEHAWAKFICACEGGHILVSLQCSLSSLLECTNNPSIFDPSMAHLLQSRNLAGVSYKLAICPCCLNAMITRRPFEAYQYDGHLLLWVHSAILPLAY